ncbi:hypothetical protein GGR50DRAFT_641615 [Xylaria sp. CBS 124048]|nr:hypothetical protein GGR50DRAFT_641615 [Xylaria sp. CBS 124048]
MHARGYRPLTSAADAATTPGSMITLHVPSHEGKVQTIMALSIQGPLSSLQWDCEDPEEFKAEMNCKVERSPSPDGGALRSNSPLNHHLLLAKEHHQSIQPREIKIEDGLPPANSAIPRIYRHRGTVYTYPKRLYRNSREPRRNPFQVRPGGRAPSSRFRMSGSRPSSEQREQFPYIRLATVEPRVQTSGDNLGLIPSDGELAMLPPVLLPMEPATMTSLDKEAAYGNTDPYQWKMAMFNPNPLPIPIPIRIIRSKRSSR